MTPMTIAKLTLALIAAVLFGIGVRNDNPALRIAAIAFLTLASFIRFIDRNRSNK